MTDSQAPCQTAAPDKSAAAGDATATAGQPLRVLHVAAGNLYGGVERMLTTIAECEPLCPQMQAEFCALLAGLALARTHCGRGARP